MLKIAIVDDEFKSRELLKVLVQNMGDHLQVVGAAGNIPDSMALIKANPPDVLLLDVELGAETGFDLLEQLPRVGFEVIFTTAHSHYALQAIKCAAIDYLLKPINPDELKNAIDKAHARQDEAAFAKKIQVLLQNLQAPPANRQKLALPTNDGLSFVPVDTIIYCQADGAYTTIYTQDSGKIVVCKNLKEYETLLAGHPFFRVHHSYLINLNQITKYIKGEGGYVVMSNKACLDVSKRRKEAFLAAIGRH